MLAATPDWQRYIILAPAFVIGIGLVAAIFILLGRAFAETVRESGHPRLIVGLLGGVVAAVVVLTYLGVTLPRE